MSRFSFLLLALGLCLPSTARAQAPKPLEITVCDLQNGGGLVTTKDGMPLEQQYSQGLAHYLAQHLKAPEFRITRRKKPRKMEEGTLFLTGDLAKIGGADGVGSSYLCQLRLNRATGGKWPQLVNSWSGFAQNYRWLSSNLSNDPDLNREGLLGALGEKVVAQIEVCRAMQPAIRAQNAAARYNQILTQTPANTFTFEPFNDRKLKLTSRENGQLVVFAEANPDAENLLLLERSLLANTPSEIELNIAPKRTAPKSLLFLLCVSSKAEETPDLQTRGLGGKTVAPSKTDPLLDEQKMEELRRQIAPPDADFRAQNVSAKPRRTDSSSGFDGPLPVRVLEGAAVTPAPALFPDTPTQKWLAARFVWR